MKPYSHLDVMKMQSRARSVAGAAAAEEQSAEVTNTKMAMLSQKRCETLRRSSRLGRGGEEHETLAYGLLQQGIFDRVAEGREHKEEEEEETDVEETEEEEAVVPVLLKALR